MSQPAVDTQNAAFWDTLCGWNLAQSAGITGRGGFEAPGGPKVQYHLEYDLDG